MELAKEVYALWRLELARNLRSARVLALLALYAAFSILVLLITGSAAKALHVAAGNRVTEMNADPTSASDPFAGARTGIVGWLFSGDTTLAAALEHVPLMVLLVFKFTLVFLPLYVALMGFDQISGELNVRSIRYLAVRARRSSVLVGKYLAHATLLLALVLVVDAGIFAYAKATQEDFPLLALVTFLPRFWLAAAIFSAAYLALTSLCSALFRAPALSLIFNLVALFVLWLANLSAQGDSSLALLAYLSPTHYADGLLHPQIRQFATSVAGCAAIGAAFLGISYWILRVRDI